jgi:hypothetical protein
VDLLGRDDATSAQRYCSTLERLNEGYSLSKACVVAPRNYCFAPKY